MGKYKIRKIGFIVGILLMLIIGFMPTPEGLTVVGQRVLAVTVLMVVFWITEAMPIPFTAWLPILLFPLMGITGAKGQNEIKLFTHYAYQTCFLLVGVGFLSGSMVKHNLHKRISLGIVSKIGKRPTTLILGFILAVAFVSMWMSNTAATVMMLPVAMAIAKTLGDEAQGLKKAMLLSIPYAATIGGMATTIGTTTNPTGIGLIQETIGIEINFVDWLKIGLPFTIILLPLMWVYMVKFFKVDKMPPVDISIARKQYQELGPMSKGEKWTAIVFLCCCVLWCTRSLVWGKWIPFASDETVAMLGAFLVMAIPLDYKKGEYVCDWKTGFNDIPWNAYILLGGSMVMGNAFKDAGVAAWVANMLQGLAGMNAVVICIIVGIATALLTELTTNAVVVAAFIPVLVGVGEAVGVNPFAMMIACMLSCNFAFMLPPATPPNAIAYGTGEVTMKDLVKCGLGLKIIALIIFPFVLYGITMGIFKIGVV
ncbi:DASS family sodium-coupled anion symporter [uncultured Dysosmobacter sp.]|uniref:SLC13 family permease n=1 Tax=uncultured Dysosmobacter sp. TaxID=2591384 RepID=UPI00261E3E1B|nr:DASS family sodium-coupled anion symporter [uncultured Dysosmobacter sp.]